MITKKAAGIKISAQRNGFDIFLILLSSAFLLSSTPGFNFWGGSIVSFAILMWVYDRKHLSMWRAAIVVGVVYYTVGLSWVYYTMTFFGNAPGWAAVLLVAVAGIFGGVVFFAPFGYVIDKTGSPLLGGMVLVALEMFKGKYLFGGLPWLNIAQTQHNNRLSIQLVSIVGEYGLTFLIVLLGCYLFKIIKYKYRRQDLAVIAVCLVLFFGYGALKLSLVGDYDLNHTARVVQTGLMQKDKMDIDKVVNVALATNLIAMDAHEKEGDYDFMVFPESTYAFDPFDYGVLYDTVNYISNNNNVIMGYDREDNASSGLVYYNSVVHIKDGAVAGSYNKMKLAPFGEYFPLEKQLRFIKEFFFGDLPMFSSGVSNSIFEIGDLRLAPLICFESVFSELWKMNVDAGANVILLMSNDSWFGDSIGREQHMAIDRLHAVEYGRFLLRATQDGISGVVSPEGDVLVQFPQWVRHIEDVKFATISTNTLFAKFGYIWYVLVLIGFGVKILSKRAKGRQR